MGRKFWSKIFKVFFLSYKGGTFLLLFFFHSKHVFRVIYWRLKIFIDFSYVFTCTIDFRLVTSYVTIIILQRHRNHLNPQFARLTCTQRSVFYSAPKAWNELPEEIRSCPNFYSFKAILKNGSSVNTKVKISELCSGGWLLLS